MCIPHKPTPVLVGQAPLNYTTIGMPLKYLTIFDMAVGFKANPPQAHALQAQIEHLKYAQQACYHT